MRTTGKVKNRYSWSYQLPVSIISVLLAILVLTLFINVIRIQVSPTTLHQERSENFHCIVDRAQFAIGGCTSQEAFREYGRLVALETTLILRMIPYVTLAILVISLFNFALFFFYDTVRKGRTSAYRAVQKSISVTMFAPIILLSMLVFTLKIDILPRALSR